MATAEAKLHAQEFTNEPFVDFSLPANKQAMQDALAKVAGEFGREYPMYIGGQKVFTTEKMMSTNPSRPSQVIGVFQKANADQAGQAVEAAHAAFASWKRVSAEKRVEIIFRAAQIFRERKFEVSALICYEVGKSWIEADADTAETIDFCEFYAREMLRLAGEHPVTPQTGEKNFLVYIPLGVGAVIPPWNFPAAIAAGMTAASLVTGNTVVLKPVSYTHLDVYKRQPVRREPRVTGSPEMRYFVMISSAWRSVMSGEMVTGSTIMPLSERFTRSISSYWRSMGMLRCTMPIPPWRAMAMARRDSVTVSMAADASGILSLNCRVKCVRVSTSVGSTEDLPGKSKTSSNVRPSEIGPSIMPSSLRRFADARGCRL